MSLARSLAAVVLNCYQLSRDPTDHYLSIITHRLASKTYLSPTSTAFETPFSFSYNMARTKQTARMSTGGHARRVVLDQHVAAQAASQAAQVDQEMCPATPTLNLQVSTHCIVEHL